MATKLKTEKLLPSDNIDGKLQEKFVTITKKVREDGTLGDLIEVFETQMKKIRIHLFNIRRQFQQYRLLREKMHQNEVLLHIDLQKTMWQKLRMPFKVRILVHRSTKLHYILVYYTSAQAAKRKVSVPYQIPCSMDLLQSGRT